MIFMFRGEIIAQYDRDYRHDETNFKLEHYIDLIERKPRSVYDAAPVKKDASQAVLRVHFDAEKNLRKPFR